MTPEIYFSLTEKQAKLLISILQKQVDLNPKRQAQSAASLELLLAVVRSFTSSEN